ncbi:MAG TPA: trigger factor [Pyrinomonadaceae bacterium]|nr:trigger factor [Chloracidobacterium sp.]MBP9936550.1 trigger factor [Pyrinomonadaceae bacterium]MBK7802771.1 trigger factor [Chloracidobacterium sp.]MBK9767207.1 trigger factor [Chloracidobacterium sp.]MBL0240290.1 trigger factor [Chloracidobacterium sp.]
MKSELKEISPTQREIHLEIDAELLKTAYGKVSQQYAKRANVPGFRKGFAPLDVVRMRFSEEIKSEVLQEVIPGQVTAAIQEHELHPLAEPHLHLEDRETLKVNGSQSIKLHIHVEVMPEIPTPKYKGIEVTRRVKPIADGEVEDLIAERLQKEAALIPVEGRKSKLGDTVIADLEGVFADEADAEPIKADDLEVELGGEHIEVSFTENLVGVKPDEEKDFTVVYPETFSSEALAGKTVNYKAKIKSVGRAEVPELNDAWAKSLDEGYKSLADLRKTLKADLVKYAETDADARLRNNAIAKLIEDNAFEIPTALIENQARNLLNNFAEDLQQRGVDLSKVESQFVEMAYNNMRTQAERDVRGALLLDKVAELEKVDVSETEINEEIQKLADYYRASAEEIRESLEKQGGGVENIRNNLKTRKSIEAVIAKAKVTDGEWIDESVGQPETAEKPKKEAKKKAPAKKAAKKSE